MSDDKKYKYCRQAALFGVPAANCAIIPHKEKPRLLNRGLTLTQ
ncbi:MAG: hypothetical protein PHE17_12120 [Thiothrix sp.]|nr:hypothetical protein [Thiothrix sp.]MDD5393756.1 hypothetical protein [Thiothrix sp.]